MADFSVVSLSQRTVVYKGLLRARQLGAYYPDLEAPDIASALVLVHSRFSTNTLGTWDLAHPFNLLCHNGEINTVRGNGAWLTAREPQLRSEVFGGDLQKLFPIAEERWSDSAKLDAMTELLVLDGRSLPHALAMLVPPVWTDPTLDLDDDVRAFHEYHASLVEPWDGPAALLASDGVQVVATLDRNGLRPCRFVRTRDGLVVIASEVGVLDIAPAEIVEAGRLEPGRMLVADTISGRLIRDARDEAGAGGPAAVPAVARPAEAVPRRPAAAAGRGAATRRAPPPPVRVRLHTGGPPVCWSARWRATALNRLVQWVTTRRWRPCRSGPSCSPPTSSSTSPRSRTRPSTRSARRS